MADETIDLRRRGFLRGRAALAVLRPPWARIREFTTLCTRCGACAKVYPMGILRAGDGGFPEVDFTHGECSFCGACADTCPESVFDRSLARLWALSAVISQSCLSAQGVVCRNCQDACPESAIRFTLVLGGVAQPAVETGACTGCGACVASCPVGAVTVQAQPEDAHAA